MRNTLILLALAACGSPETGIDGTVLTGTLSIPPALVDEVDTRTSPNSDPSLAQPLGVEGSSALSYRAVVVSGVTRNFQPEGLGERFGDADWYAFSPAASGTWNLTLDLGPAARRGPPPPPDSGLGDTGSGPSFVDPIVYTLEVYDAAAFDGDGGGLVYAGTTDGMLDDNGIFTAEVPVAAGTDYLVLVGGLASTTPESTAPYLLTLPGSDPSTAGILVGAYAGSDPTVAEPPLGGTTPTDWAQDGLTWTASYSISGLRGLTNVADEDTADEVIPNPTLAEGAEKVYLRAATIPVLNASPAAGALYSTASVEVTGLGAAVDVAAPIVLDGVFPKVVGLQVTEDEESSCVVTADTTLEEATLMAQDVGMASGLGFVDIFDGTIEFDPTVEGWEGNDSDVFQFTVPEPMFVRMTVGWADPAADIDIGIFGAYEDYGLVDWFSGLGDSYCLTGSNPEVCETVVELQPGQPYYLAVLGYLGTDPQAWHAELEWIAP